MKKTQKLCYVLHIPSKVVRLQSKAAKTMHVHVWLPERRTKSQYFEGMIKFKCLATTVNKYIYTKKLRTD